MKKNMVLLVLGSLLCPMVLATADSVVDSSQSTLQSKKEISVTSSLERPEYTEAIESSSSEIKKVERTIMSTTSSEEESFEKRIERLRNEATTPEEYQEVLEYIKRTTNYNQVEKSDIDSYSFKSGVNRAGQARGVAEFLGISKQQLLNELQAHEYDNFYLGTPFRGLWTPSIQCMIPNGAPHPSYSPGFNCTGFVATAFQRAGGDLRRITNIANAWGDVCNAYNWRDALKPNTEHYTFNSVNELLASGKAEKGDVIYFEPDYTVPNFDCHIGFFWGSRSNENLMWHSYDKNIKSNIKSATPFTKIYLFKLGDNKDEVIYDKKMNNERFVGTNNAAVYENVYKKGTKKIDTTSGLYAQQVKVTREVKNGYGIWQEMTYKRDGKVRKGWVQSSELIDVIDKKSFSEKLALNHINAAVYDRPYYPDAKRIQILADKKGLPLTISEKARTGYGEWYKVSYIDGNSQKSGWMKTTDLARIVNQQSVNLSMTVNKEFGSIFDSPYTGDNDTKWIGNTHKLYTQVINVSEEAYTGYGHWYKTKTVINNQQVDGWIKADDLGEYYNFEKLDTRMIANKHDGAVYDSPYVASKTKKIDDLHGLKDQVFDVVAIAETDRGTWYQTNYVKNNTKKSGWIKSVDLDQIVDNKPLNKKVTVKIGHGSIFNKPFIGSKDTEKLGTTKDLEFKTIDVIEEARTGYGTWNKTRTIIDGQKVDGWIKVDDLGEYYNFEKLDTKMIANKHNGAVYDTPYVASKTKKIDDLHGLKDQVFDVVAIAETDRGTWYQTNYVKNNTKKSGWIKSVDLEQIVDKKSLNKKMTVKIGHGSIFNKPFIGSKDTKKLGTTKDLEFKTIDVTEEARTGYGTWNKTRTIIDNQEVDGWIKVDDLGEYYNFKKIDSMMIVNKHNGAVYDTPYVKNITKKIDDLNGLKGDIVTVKAVAETDRGIWYQTDYVKNNSKRTGWIKSIDLNDLIIGE